MMLSRLDKTRYEFSKKGCTINRIIDAMIENKLLEKMNSSIQGKREEGTPFKGEWRNHVKWNRSRP